MRYEFAPLEGITGYLFRNVHHRFYPGADLYYTPFLSPGSARRLSSREKNEILPGHNRGFNVVPQLLTNKAEDFIWAAGELAQYGYKEINLNLGCPSATVVTKQKGAGFLADPDHLDRFFADVFEGLSREGLQTEVSVKTRLGFIDLDEFEELMEVYNRYPLKELIIHARLRSEFYSGHPHLQEFMAGAVTSSSQVCYNGDLFTVEDCRQMISRLSEIPQVTAVMAGRGAIADPALFSRLKGIGQEQSASMTGLQCFHAFHDELLEGYREIMSGDRNALFKMKELWHYWSCRFPEQAKILKKIKKAQKMADYQMAVEELFGTGGFDESASYHGN